MMSLDQRAGGEEDGLLCPTRQPVADYLVTANSPPSAPDSIAPPIMAEVVNQAVEVWPAAAGWGGIVSTAEPPIRPVPAAPPMIARPAPTAPPNQAAPLLGRNVAFSPVWAISATG